MYAFGGSHPVILTRSDDTDYTATMALLQGGGVLLVYAILKSHHAACISLNKGILVTPPIRLRPFSHHMIVIG